MISVYGSTGFIGSRFCAMYPEETCPIPREQREPESGEILYLISTTHNYNVFDNPFLDIDTNLKVLIEALEVCRERQVTFNFVSSWFVYGETDLPAREDAICRPRGFYSITKKAAEDLLVSYCQTFGMNYRIFRLANVIGSGDRPSKQKNALQFIADRLHRHESVELYHGGNFIRDYLHVDDVCRAMKLSLEKAPRNEVLNIGSGTPQTFKALTEKLVKLTRSQSELLTIDPPSFHRVVQVKDMWLDISKLNRLGFQLTMNMDQALQTILPGSLEQNR